MKYMQNGGFQNHPLMRLTLTLTLIFLVGFWITNFLLYFSKMGLTPGSVVSYYLGSEEEFRPARSYQSMLETTHFHLPMMALVILMLTHLLIFVPFRYRTKVGFILTTFLSGLLNEGAGWLVRFVSLYFAWVKVVSFLILQGSLAYLLSTLLFFLWRGRSNGKHLNSDVIDSQ
ncbi:MAG: hypothetical protein HY709_00160 [Candidatus Latescibacteria bacterium]|nr:hypothetical protein [Candidatus Latescibacterota bacterium]